jgi:site-specific recombinase XerD
MTSENAQTRRSEVPESASENTQQVRGPRRHGRRPTPLPVHLEAVHTAYTCDLAHAPVSPETKRTYASKVRGFLAWLADADLDGDPLTDPKARDWAVRDWRAHLLTIDKRATATINNAFAAVDDFYIRRGLGPANADRIDPPTTAPRALTKRATTRWLRAVEAWLSCRDRAIAAIPFYAGARIAEVVRLDVDDVRRSRRKGLLRIHGKSDKIREVPLHTKLHEDLDLWLAERPDWPGADTNPALFLNRRSARLSVRGASAIIADIGRTAGLDEQTTAHILRHSFATTLIRGGTDLVVVAELLGHARLETVRAYTKPTEEDKAKALNLLPVDR